MRASASARGSLLATKIGMTDPTRQDHPVEHEGAEDSDQPNEPAAREVITPDWVELEKLTEHQEEKSPPAGTRDDNR